VAFGVLLDTMIVRSVLVTALTLDVDRWMWWPSKLFKQRDTPESPAGGPDLEPALRGT
jgi:RND superfamily putative drug exporter